MFAMIAPHKDADMQHVTLKDIARVAGLHVTTVSLALHGREHISLATRDRVHEIAERLGYRGNPIASALTQRRLQRASARRTPKIAFVVNRVPEPIANPCPKFAGLFAGAQHEASQLGFDLDLLYVGIDRHSTQSLAEYLQQQQISAVLLAAFEPGHASLDLEWNRFAVAKVDSLHFAPNLDTIGQDHLLSVRIAYQRLRDYGYRRVGLLAGQADEDAVSHRYTLGYLREQALIPPSERVPALYLPYNPDPVRLRDVVAKWIVTNRIGGVLTTVPNISDFLQTTPNPPSYASLWLADDSPAVAGIRVRFDVVGQTAVSVLTANLRSGSLGGHQFPTQTYVKVAWQDGRSAPRRRRYGRE